ncbi:tetratricopeptide repeat family protein [Halobacteriovorax marinus SJ]|uniref:Tetratricopeptide repeat family protein n=1 Tax=Halobacteriovorax marinus (strain ATCC BAA-682 / DSM 15412 / SJ) TaxID=862908 RepID=E1X1R1_HALMS|nr:tetratricopeptide repeat protein [Halobacteriovorax marinus]CBW24980.1 tetratricopeptide repeat family protein [Halobacteriovorax marinus SJ]
MSKKYRVKLINDRIVGPFVAEQIGELYVKGHLLGDEKCQVFPVGDWLTLKDFDELKEIIVKATKEGKIKAKDSGERTQTFARINKPKTKKQAVKKDKGFQEFQYKKEDISRVDYEALEEKFKEEAKELESIEEELGHVNEVPVEEPEENDGVEKTVIINRSSLSNDNVDKTVIVNPNPFREKVEEKIEDEPEEDTNSEEEEEVEEEPKEEVLNTQEATEFINVKELLPDIKQVANVAEKEFEEKVIEEEAEEAKLTPEKKVKEEEAEEKEKKKSKRKKTTPIVAVAFIVILWTLLFPEKEEKKLDPVRVSIQFPIQAEFLDSVKSTEALNRGLDHYSQGTYLSKIKASLEFSKSLHHQFKNNKALGYLILTYSEIFENSNDEKKSIRTIFKLIEIARSKMLSDANVAAGSALFYQKIGKAQSANRILENFIRINKPTVNLLSIYLNVLIEVGNYIEARKVFDMLSGLKNKNEATYLSILNFYEENDLQDKVKETIAEARNSFPKSIPLLLRYAKYQFDIGDYKKYEAVLKVIQSLNSGRSPMYYAKFLEYMGILAAIKKDNNKAVLLFRLALKIHESDELRSKLSLLELGGSSNVEKIILESKIVELMKKAKNAVKERKWEIAFINAIKASDLDSSYIPAQLLLGNIQVKRGYYEDAIKTFNRMKKEYPLNKKINIYLVEAYIKAFKLSKAEVELRTLAQSKLSDSYIFYSLQAKYYLRREFYENAISKFKESIKRNPVNDDDYFELAKIYLKFRKFKSAKNMLTRSISLDPVNIEYHSAYANILYELEGAETAIGYLRNLLKQNRDNPKILGDIAIYYYKNGQNIEFQEYKKRVEKLASTDASFYEFLIYSAELDDRDDDVIKYGKELIKINPGDLDVQIKLGKNLYDKGLYKEALNMFESILARLESFPRANYYLAKTYIKLRDLKKAHIMAEREVKNNPSLEFGYFILGEVFRLEKKYREAELNFKRSISKNGRYVEALMGMGWIKWKQGYLDRAREYYLKALKENQNNGEIHRALGYIYKEIGQSSLAIDSFRVYLDLTPAAKDRAQIQGLMKSLR